MCKWKTRIASIPLLIVALLVLVCCSSNQLTAEELAQFQNMFGDPQGGYKPFLTMFLSSQYQRPEDIHLGWLFREGVPNQEPGSTSWGYSISPEEWDALAAVMDPESFEWLQDADAYKTPRPVIEDILNRYLGLSLEDSGLVGLDSLLYLPEYDAYYSGARDTAMVWPHFTAGTWLENGGVELVYHNKLQCENHCDNPDATYLLTLTPWEEGWRFVSNYRIDYDVFDILTFTTGPQTISFNTSTDYPYYRIYIENSGEVTYSITLTNASGENQLTSSPYYLEAGASTTLTNSNAASGMRFLTITASDGSAPGYKGIVSIRAASSADELN